MGLRIIFSLAILALLQGSNVVEAGPHGRSIPDTIYSCYQNATAFHRYTRQPMHIENLIAIIRKLEEKTNNQWTIREMARTIVKQFQFDGMTYDATKRVEFRFETDLLEDHRTAIVHSILPDEKQIPDGALDNDERCALHWMLSHAINITLRDEEERPSRYRNKREVDSILFSSEEIDSSSMEAEGEKQEEISVDTNASTETRGSGILHNTSNGASDQKNSSHGFGRLISGPTTKRPLEAGVVYTKWGSVAGGTLLLGIAAGLEPVEKPVDIVDRNAFSGRPPVGPGNGFPQIPAGTVPRTRPTLGPSSKIRSKRQSGGNYLAPLLNYYAATLAGDIGQAAILNGVFSSDQLTPPVGQFNDSICPREYILNSKDNDGGRSDVTMWSYMTAAEIRGGIDGLILGQKLQDWDRQFQYRLSEILDMYYSEKGVVGLPRYRACNRGLLFETVVDKNTLLEQSKSFAYVFNNRTSSLKVATAGDINTLLRLVQEAYQKLLSFTGTLSSYDPPCQRPESGSSRADTEKFAPALSNVYVVLDHTDTSDPDLTQQKRFAAQLAYELQVNKWGARLGIVNGGTSQLVIKPNYTDNAPILACKILSERSFPSQQQALPMTLTTLQTELTRIRQENVRLNHTDKNGDVILFLNQGKKFDSNMKDDVRARLDEFERDFGDVHVMYATSKYSAGDYEDFVFDRDLDVIRIAASGNLSSGALRFAQEFVKKNHGRLANYRCGEEMYDADLEDKIPTHLYVTPNTIQYYKISPVYFYSAGNLRLRFTSSNGRAVICVSRSDRYPNKVNNGTSNGVNCQETSGQYVTPGDGNKDVEFPFSKACGGKRKREGCEPIYISITPVTDAGADGINRLDCNVENCQYEDQVKVTFSHWDMRCNLAHRLAFTFPLLGLAFLLPLLRF